MPTYTVGAGKTYDSANGILLALNDVPNDFASETEDHIIEVYPGYDYAHNMPTKKVLTNTSDSKKLIIKPALGYEHKGNFSSGISIRNSGSSLFLLQGNYIEFKDFKLIPSGTSSRPYMYYLQGNCENCLFQNVLFDVNEDEGITTDQIYLFWHESGSFNNSIINNTVLYNDGLTTAGVVAFISLFSSSANGTKINNCISFNANWHYYSAGLAVQYNNCGAIGGGAQWAYATGSSGSKNNYGTVPGIGTNYLQLTKSGFKFTDIDNKKFTPQITSQLIGTGGDATIDNPRDIRGNLWQGNHRSPFNNIIITNAYMQPPEDTEYIRGNWMNGMIYNCLQPGGKIVIGELTSLLAYGSHILGYDYAGFSTKCAYSTNFNTLLRPINGKFLTISTLIKRFGSSGLNSNPFGSGGTYLTVDTSPSNRIRFTINTDYYADSTSLSSYVNVNDYFNVICQVNLEATTNSERIKIYLYQKGFLHHVVLTFTGTPPSSFNETSDNWNVGYHADFQGITSVWDRLLAFEEMYTIAYDPYVIYRSDKKLFRMLNIIPEGLGNGLWFLRKFIMGN
jgi:hypothetical protein